MDVRLLICAIFVAFLVLMIQVSSHDTKKANIVVYEGQCQIENVWIGYNDKVFGIISFPDGFTKESSDPVIAKKVFYGTVAEPCECIRYADGRVKIQ